MCTDILQQFGKANGHWTFNDDSGPRIVVECPIAVESFELLLNIQVPYELPYEYSTNF